MPGVSDDCVQNENLRGALTRQSGAAHVLGCSAFVQKPSTRRSARKPPPRSSRRAARQAASQPSSPAPPPWRKPVSYRRRHAGRPRLRGAWRANAVTALYRLDRAEGGVGLSPHHRLRSVGAARAGASGHIDAMRTWRRGASSHSSVRKRSFFVSLFTLLHRMSGARGITAQHQCPSAAAQVPPGRQAAAAPRGGRPQGWGPASCTAPE